MSTMITTLSVCGNVGSFLRRANPIAVHPARIRVRVRRWPPLNKLHNTCAIHRWCFIARAEYRYIYFACALSDIIDLYITTLYHTCLHLTLVHSKHLFTFIVPEVGETYLHKHTPTKTYELSQL